MLSFSEEELLEETLLPLQLLGIETDVLNTVQYSNHVGYRSFAGEKMTGEQVWDLLQGMHA